MKRKNVFRIINLVVFMFFSSWFRLRFDVDFLSWDYLIFFVLSFCLAVTCDVNKE